MPCAGYLLSLVLLLVLKCPLRSATAARYSRPVVRSGGPLMPKKLAAGSDTVSEYSECMHYLHQYQPLCDRTIVSEAILNRTAALALRARSDTSWGKAVPWDVFLDYVLPYYSLDEKREDWRGMFYEMLAPLVRTCESITEAALLLNRDIWRVWGIHFKADQAPEILAPSEVIKAGFGSCSALSIFLVAAYRAVGIPARVAGTPSWVQDKRTRGERFNNHNWVEVWDRGVWSFTGAAEYTYEGLNRTWFFPEPARHQIPGDRVHAIYAAAFRPGPSNTSFPLAWDMDDSSVSGIDVTRYYLDMPDEFVKSKQL